MSQQPPPDDQPKESRSQTDSVLPPAEEKKLEAIIEKGVERIPPDQFPTFFRDTLIAFIERGAGPKIDPESFKIAAATVEKDNDNRLTYLMRKLELEDEKHKRDHTLETARQNSTVKMLWPILLAVIILVIGCVTSGIYLAATGKETLGFSILSGTVAALFSYLGGLGTPRFWKDN
jgi:hypothetical protein